MFKFYIGRGTVRTTADFAIKQIYSSQSTFNYPVGYIDKLLLEKEVRNPFHIEMENKKPNRLEVQNAKLIGFSHRGTINKNQFLVELKNQTPVRFIYFRLLQRHILFIYGY